MIASERRLYLRLLRSHHEAARDNILRAVLVEVLHVEQADLNLLSVHIDEGRGRKQLGQRGGRVDIVVAVGEIDLLLIDGIGWEEGSASGCCILLTPSSIGSLNSDAFYTPGIVAPIGKISIHDQEIEVRAGVLLIVVETAGRHAVAVGLPILCRECGEIAS